ncbi:MAG: metal-dependent transcriptional regulator [Dehalococcoidia bacterium]
MVTRKKSTSNRAPHVRPGRMSQAGENYLLSLAILQEDGVAPHISELASYLRRIPPEEGVGTTLASVSGMVQRMAKEGLLEVSKEKRVVLTPEGERAARDVVRRHRLSERLLVDVLDVPLEQAESEAHQLEHAISPGLLKRIEERLGFPESCPYGRPIYRADELGIRKEAPGTIRLSESKSGLDYIIVRIPDEDYPLLHFLVTNRVLPDQRITVDDTAEYRGVVDIRLDGEKVSLGMEVAARIRVKPA